MIQVRPLIGKDAPALVEMAQHPHIREALLLDDLAVTEERVTLILTDAEPGTTTEAYGILVRGKLVGTMCLANQHPIHRTATITNLAAMRKAGANVGREAMEWLVRHAFLVRNLRRLECRVWEGNRITPRLIAGFPGAVKEGVLRQAIFRRGRFIDVTLYSLLREEWQDAYSTEAA